MQGTTQFVAERSFELKRRSWPPIELERGSSFWAARASPAESRRLEMVPSAMRLIVFIGERLGLPRARRRFLKSPIFTNAFTFFPVVKRSVVWGKGPILPLAYKTDSCAEFCHNPNCSPGGSGVSVCGPQRGRSPNRNRVCGTRYRWRRCELGDCTGRSGRSLFWFRPSSSL
jgi:hypothetical protein